MEISRLNPTEASPAATAKNTNKETGSKGILRYENPKNKLTIINSNAKRIISIFFNRNNNKRAFKKMTKKNV
jgi:hypothetical protein